MYGAFEPVRTADPCFQIIRGTLDELSVLLRSENGYGLLRISVQYKNLCFGGIPKVTVIKRSPVHNVLHRQLLDQILLQIVYIYGGVRALYNQIVVIVRAGGFTGVQSFLSLVKEGILAVINNQVFALHGNLFCAGNHALQIHGNLAVGSENLCHIVLHDAVVLNGGHLQSNTIVIDRSQDLAHNIVHIHPGGFSAA